ncbi:MAG: methionyl-tRNA formyltransferase [Firmicutes bacterium HGW-Firmicutes-21]|nr:MAG: methionyl-tRNA formyltransferase [Firmicutes bacterium HGW-Firmicutes-21]
MKIVFMGTPEFASVALEALIADGQDIALVVSQSDKPKGRGYHCQQSEVKRVALAHGIEVITPRTLKDDAVIERLRNIGADLFIVAAYGKILPKSVLEIPPLGCINIHASLLPLLRGAAPINRAVMEGHRRGGITIMFMDEGIDTGDIILQKVLDIPADMTAGEYHDKMAVLGGQAIISFMRLAESGNIPRTAQDNSIATYARKIEKSDCYISFNQTAEQTVNHIRALNPCPCAYCFLCGKRIKIFSARIGSGTGKPGSILSAGKTGIEVACSEGSVFITELCPEGKCRVTADEYIRGNKTEVGACFNV